MKSETVFMKALELILDPLEFEITYHPRDLTRIIANRYGVIPEALVRHRATDRRLYFEVKKQKDGGNADERGAKHHTTQFYAEINKLFNYDYHPFVTIMCEALATNPRYVLKHPFFYEQDHFFCWVDYDLDLLADFIARVVSKWLVPVPPREPLDCSSTDTHGKMTS